VQAILWPIVSWIFREVVIKFVILGALFVVVAELMPIVIGWITPFVSTTALNGAFALIPSSGWYFFDLFKLDVGFPLLISAAVYRFLIRRIPLIG
jgi:hypothetical protein